MRLIGRYELQERIGEGAMAEVWRAHDPSIARTLAVKILKADLAGDPECAVRFLREAKAAGVLAHPSIVSIYDVGEDEGRPYIAMELLDGEPLDVALAARGPLAPDAALAVAGQLAGALAYAHAAGVVHRDIKPSNIVLGADGHSAKLLDFGIARVAEAASEREQVRTQVGQVMGTPRYMSPEQALGRPADGRSDLFSLGAVLYEAVTGKPAFTGGSPAILALQITQASHAPIAELVPACPGGLRFIIDKLLAKRPEKRFQDGAELVRAVERERKAFDAVRSEETARRGLPLQVRLTLAMVAVTAVALAVSIGAVLDQQYRAMERMALASGSAISAFVASNAALPAVENAGAPEAERDWAPIQAFIAAAAKDQSVRWMTMVDADGIVRGASDPAALGKRYRTPAGEAVVHSAPEVKVTSIRLDDGREGFRFVHPILYAGRPFGLIEVSLDKASLQAAAATSRNLLVGLGAVMLLVVGGLSFSLAKLVDRPLRRVTRALRDGAMGDLDFRISHSRRDEFGQLFDGFNTFAAAMQERLEAAVRATGGPRPLEATRIGPRPAPIAPPEPAPAASPFDPAWKRSA